MKYIKLFAKIIAFVIAMTLITGCGAEPAYTESEATIDASSDRFEFGQIVWSVRYTEDGTACLMRYTVVAHDAEFVAAIATFTTDIDQFREVLVDVTQMPLSEAGYLDVLLVSNCYLDREDAQAIVDEFNGD